MFILMQGSKQTEIWTRGEVSDAKAGMYSQRWIGFLPLVRVPIEGHRMEIPSTGEAMEWVAEQVGGNQAALSWNSDSTTH